MVLGHLADLVSSRCHYDTEPCSFGRRLPLIAGGAPSARWSGVTNASPGQLRPPLRRLSPSNPLALPPRPPASALAHAPASASASPAAPHLREELLAPRFHTTEIDKAARTCLDLERPAFEAMLGEMEDDYNRDHFDRQAPLGRLQALSPWEKRA